MLAKPDDQTAIFEASAICITPMTLPYRHGIIPWFVRQGIETKRIFANGIEIAAQEDKFDTVRALYTDMLRGQLEHGNNGMVKTKFLVLTIEAKNSKEQKPVFPGSCWMPELL